MIGQVLVRSASSEVVGGSLPFKSTFVVNTNGDFTVHATDGGQKVFKHIDSKANTLNNICSCSEN